MSDGRELLHDRYRLERALSRSGASTTWDAHDTRRDARCVVKELSVGAVVRDGSGSASFDGDDFTKVIDLFEREARVLEHLDHPRVPGFIEHFRIETEADTRLYTVQEFVEGKTLEALVAGGRHFTEDEATGIADQLLEILEYLHDRSPPLIHRDIKPANVIIAPDGAVHLVDFGSVRNVVDASGLDGKTIVGTYGYMPMEQYEARAVPQSDLYALGMTLVFLLSHRAPTEITRTGLTLDFRPYVQVSDRLAGLIEWMIEAAPGDRPESASALRQALGTDGAFAVAAALADVPVRRNRYPMTQRDVAVLASGIAVFLIVILAVAGLLFPGGAGLTSLDEGWTPGAAPAQSPIVPANGVLTVSIYEDFRYVDQGFPQGRAVAQTRLPPLSPNPPAGLTLPPDVTNLLFGYLPLGNGSDTRVDFALVEDAGVYSLFIDRNNNEDLSDDGPAIPNQGSGDILAAYVSVEMELRLGDGEASERPYGLWIWFNESEAGQVPIAHFYSRHYYQGVVTLNGRLYEAVAFEFSRHDGLLRESGLCIDLDGDEECQEERELFHDGDVIPQLGAEGVRLVLDYP